MEEDLLMMQEVDREACWKVYRLEEEHCQAHTIPNPKYKWNNIVKTSFKNAMIACGYLLIDK